MKRDTIYAVIIGLVLISAMVLVTFIPLRDAEPEETARVTEVELETYTEPETTCMNTEKMHDSETATLFLDTEVLTEECEDTGAVVDTAPEPTETRYLNVSPGDGYLDVPFSFEEQDLVRSLSEEYGVPFALTMAIIYTESGFDRYAYSSHGDCGLMQIAPVNHGWLSEAGLTDLWDVEQNVRAGLTILSDKLTISGGDFTTALMRYNRGDAVALEQIANGIFSTDYTEKVLGKYYEYTTILSE